MTLDAAGALAEARASRAGPSDRPYVTLTYAQSLDGSIAAASGHSLRLSGPESMMMTHRLRAGHQAILVGIGTLLADDPQLTVRLAPGDQPQPVVVDTHLRTLPSSRILRHPRSPWIAGVDPFPSEARDSLVASGAEILAVRGSEDGRVDLLDLLHTLSGRGVQSLLVEGGSRILHSFLAQRLVDWVIVTVVPRFVAGKPALDGSDGFLLPSLQHPGVAPSGADVLIWGRPTWKST